MHAYLFDLARTKGAVRDFVRLEIFLYCTAFIALFVYAKFLIRIEYMKRL